MIRLVFGLPGGGKTLHIVREMALNPSSRPTFANISTTKLKNVVTVDSSMFIVKTQLGTKKDGTPKYEYKLNEQFWREQQEKHGAINVIIDEAHTLMNARRTQEKKSIIMNDFISLIRRILGSTPAGYGEATFITQIPRRIDVNLREMATDIRHCLMHYDKECLTCGCNYIKKNGKKYRWHETNAQYKKHFFCTKCKGYNIIQKNHYIEVWCFPTIEHYSNWYELGVKTYYTHYFIKNVSKYFSYYNTLQWDNLVSDVGK